MNQPSNGLSTLALLLAVAVLSGCTSMHVVEYTQGASLPPAVEVGDRIRVLDSAGLATDLTVTAIGNDFVEGETKSDGKARMALADVQEVRERRFAWGKTALLGAGVGYLAGAAAASVALAGL